VLEVDECWYFKSGGVGGGVVLWGWIVSARDYEAQSLIAALKFPCV